MSSKPDKVIVGVSGGKDSTLSLLLAIDFVGKDKVIALFNDTQWEHPDTYEYLDYLKATVDVQWEVTRSISVLDYVRKRGKFPFGKGRFCTSYLKQYTTKKWFANYVDWTMRYEFWLGIRLDESSNRKTKYSKFEDSEIMNLDDVYPKLYPARIRNCVKLRLPILGYTQDGVFAEIKKRKVKINPRYLAGDGRVGCYPCLLAGKKVHKHVASTQLGKSRIQEIIDLADEMGTVYEPLDYDRQCQICKDS